MIVSVAIIGSHIEALLKEYRYRRTFKETPTINPEVMQQLQKRETFRFKYGNYHPLRGVRSYCFEATPIILQHPHTKQFIAAFATEHFAAITPPTEDRRDAVFSLEEELINLYHSGRKGLNVRMD